MSTKQVIARHGRAIAAVGVTLAALSGCARDAQPRTSGRAPFQAEVPYGDMNEVARRERSEIARPPTRERRLCETLGRTADMTLVPTANGVLIRLRPVDGLRADALGASRELRRALIWPAEYAAERDESEMGCGVVELGREVAIAEVREVGTSDGAVAFELHTAAWPGRGDLLRGRARVFIDEVR